MAELGLRPPHFALLTVIAAHPGATQQDLVAATDIDPSTMVQVIDELEAAGLAERHVHEHDRRKRAIHLTPAGTDGCSSARGGSSAELADDLFGAAEREERATLHGLLRKLAGC